MGFKWPHILGFAVVISVIAFMILPPEREEGILLARSGKVAEAEAKLRAGIMRDPGDQLAVLELAEAYMRSGKKDIAFKMLSDFLKRNPRDKKVRMRLVLIFESSFEYQKAISLLTYKPVDNRHKLADLYIKTGELDKAVTALKSGVKFDNKEIDTWRHIAQLEQWQLKINGVAVALEKVVALEPSTKNLQELLNLYFWLGNHKKMRQYATELNKSDDLELNDIRLLRTVWINLRALDNALDSARLAVDESDADASDWIDLSMISSWSGDYDEAIRYAAEGIEEFPDSIELHWLCANFATAAGKPLLAAEYTYKIGLLENNKETIRNAGDAFAFNKDFTRAIQIFTELNKVDPKGKDLKDLLRLTELYIEINDLKKAKRFAASALKEIQNTPSTSSKLIARASVIFDDLKDSDTQTALIEILASRGDPAAKIQLALIYSNREEYAKALEVIKGVNGRNEEERFRISLIKSLSYTDTVYTIENPATLTERRLVAIASLQRFFSLSKKLPAESPLNNTAKDYEWLRGSLVNFLLAEKEFEEAEIELALLKNPEASTILNIAVNFAENKNFSKTKYWLNKLPESRKDFTAGDYAVLGQAYLLLEETDQALENYEKANRLSGGNDKNILLALAEAYGKDNRFDKKTAILKKLAYQKGATAEEWLYYVDASAESGNDLRANTILLTEGTARFHKSAIMRARLVSLYAAIGEEKLAKITAAGLNNMQVKKDIPSLITVAYALMDVRLYKDAATVIEHAKSIDWHNSEVILVEARYSVNIEEYADAVVLYKKYLMQERDDATVWFELAQSKKSSGITGSREDALTAKKLLDIKDGETVLLASYIELFLGNKKEAISFAKNAFNLQPEMNTRPLLLSSLYNSSNMPERSLPYTMQVLDRTSSDKQALLEGADSTLQLRSHQKGIDFYRKYFKANGKEPSALAGMSFTQAEIGEWQEAITNFQTATYAQENKGELTIEDIEEISYQLDDELWK